MKLGLRVGRPTGEWMSDEWRTQIIQILNHHKMTLKTAARQAGMTYHQFYLPLQGRTTMSQDKKDKFEAFISEWGK